MTTMQDLAQQVLRMFDLQRAYFRLRPGDPGKAMALEASKVAERVLKAECRKIVEGPQLQFGEDRP